MNDKKQLLINTALDLFYKKGINSVGINEVLQASGIAKKTLYNHFASKEALIIATLEFRHDIFLLWLNEGVVGSKTNKEFATALFRALTQWFNNQVSELADFRGCFFINTAAEFSGQSAEVMEYCRMHKAKVRALLAKSMPVKDESLLDMICVLKEGAITTAYVSKELQVAEKCLAWVLSSMQTENLANSG
jgi:AcrR family transcriptional regulator